MPISQQAAAGQVTHYFKGRDPLSKEFKPVISEIANNNFNTKQNHLWLISPN
jgi:hypothetical protein